MEGNFIKIQGQMFAIGQPIQFELFSPIFDREEVIIQGEKTTPRGQFSYPFEIIDDGQLSRLLGFPELFQVKDVAIDVEDVELYSNGERLDTGVLHINSIQRNINTGSCLYEMIFRYQDVKFLNAAGDKKVREITLPVITMPGISFANLIDASATSTVGPYSLSVKPYWNRYPADPNEIYVIRALGPPALGTGGDPFYNTNAMDFEWNDSSDPLEHLNQNTKYARSITEGDDVEGLDLICFPSHKVYTEQFGEVWLNYWEGGVLGEGYRISHVADVTVTGNGDVRHCLQCKNFLVPMFYYHKVLRQCFAELGYNLIGDLIDDTTFQKLYIFNSHSPVRPQIVEFDSVYGDAGIVANALYIEQEASIHAANHLPDISILDFIRDFMLKFCLYLRFDGSNVYIEGNQFDQIQRELKDLSPVVRIEPQEKNGVKVRYNWPSDGVFDVQRTFKRGLASAGPEELTSEDGYASDANLLTVNDNKLHTVDNAGFPLTDVSNLLDYETGDAKEFISEIVPCDCQEHLYKLYDMADDIIANIALGFFPTHRREISYNTPDKVVLVWNRTINVAGAPIDDDISLAGQKFDIYDIDPSLAEESQRIDGDTDYKQIAFYHGLKECLGFEDVNATYPYGSYHNYEPGPDNKLGDWHLGWLGTEGLIAVFWKKYANIFTRNRKFILRNYDEYRTIRKHNWNRCTLAMGVEFYVSSIKPEVPINKATIYECWEL